MDKVRFRTIDDVLDEMKYLRDKFGYLQFNIADDTFTCNKRRVEEFCRKLPAELTWFCESKANELSEELVHMMKEAGCSSIQIGVETGSDRIQATIGKGITTAMVRNAARWCFDCGILLCGGIMFPFPEDDEASARETMQLIAEVGRESNMLFFIASTLPFPGTYLGQHHAELGFEVHDLDVRHWSFTRCNVSNRALSFERVQQLQSEIAAVVRDNTLAVRKRLAEYETRLRYQPRSNRLVWGRTSAIAGHQAPQDQREQLDAHRAMWRTHDPTDFDTISSVQGRITDRIGRTPDARRRLMVID